MGEEWIDVCISLHVPDHEYRRKVYKCKRRVSSRGRKRCVMTREWKEMEGESESTRRGRDLVHAPAPKACTRT